MPTTEETKFIRKVCPNCLHETRTPNNFLNVLKFWKYETVEEAHTDLMDCVKHLNRRINQMSQRTVNVHRSCPHCPPCMHGSITDKGHFKNKE